jgi:NADH-quinone oxidoreductase subunit E
MAHYVIELVLWIICAYFIGCLAGAALRRMFNSEPVVAPVLPAPPEDVVPPVVAEPVVEAAPAMMRPAGLGEPRGGEPDDLQRISGIGPKNEKILNSLGFFHFDQLAAWTAGEIAWVDDHLKFGGRIEREKWVEQAKLLAEGREEEFVRLYGTGGKG